LSEQANLCGVLPEPSDENGFRRLDGGRARFLLGTDVHIGEPETCEQRVAVTPDQIRLLADWLGRLGVTLDRLVIRDAGKNAGFGNALYMEAGAEIVEETDLAQIEPPHVVHALKEPTHYESTIPGPFIRIGALHTGDFKPESGLAEMLAKGNYSAIYDGSAVGGFAYLTPFPVRPAFRIPLRSSMSVYAGKLAGEDVGDQLASGERVVVSGGGVVGVSAVNVLLERHADQLKEILIIEKFQERCEQLRREYAQWPMVQIKQGVEIGREEIEGAVGVILTIYVQGSGETPKVVDLDRLAAMKEGGIVVDVAIDEGGGVDIGKPGSGPGGAATVENIRLEVERLPKRLFYHADNHMPRRRPREASIEHGATTLMYQAALLYLCARHDGPAGALAAILDQDYIEKPKNILEALMLDLKHGLAFANEDGVAVLYRHNLKRSDEIRRFLNQRGVKAVFA